MPSTHKPDHGYKEHTHVYTHIYRHTQRTAVVKDGDEWMDGWMVSERQRGSVDTSAAEIARSDCH